MKRENVMRIVISAFTSQTILLTLNTTSMAGEPMINRGATGTERLPHQVDTRIAAKEQVALSNNGSKLTFTVSGRPGRYCAIAYRKSKKAQEFELLESTRTVIGPTGVALITVDLASGHHDVRPGVQTPRPLGAIYKLFTADTNDFSVGIRATTWLDVQYTNDPKFQISPQQNIAWEDEPTGNCVAGVRGRAKPGAAIQEIKGGAQSPGSGLININTASLSALIGRLDIDEAAARAIIRGRPFRDIHNLRNIRQITDEKRGDILSKITVG